MKKDRFLVYATVFLIMGLSNAVIPVLPELASRDHMSHSALASSLLFSAYFIGALVTMLPFGLLSDRYGRKRLIVFSMFLTSISGIMLLELQDTYWLTLARLIEGTACGAFFLQHIRYSQNTERKADSLANLIFCSMPVWQQVLLFRGMSHRTTSKEVSSCSR